MESEAKNETSQATDGIHKTGVSKRWKDSTKGLDSRATRKHAAWNRSRKLRASKTRNSMNNPVIDSIAKEFRPATVCAKRNELVNPPILDCTAIWTNDAPMLNAVEAQWALKNEHKIDSDLQETRGMRILKWIMGAIPEFQPA